MQAELNGFLLNEVVNAFAFLVLVVLFVNTLFDRRIRGTKRDRDFFLFTLFGALYIGLFLVWFPLEAFGWNESALLALSMLRVLTAVLAYGYFASWIISTADQEKSVSPRVRPAIKGIMVVLFVLSVVLRLATGSVFAANIPIFLYYLLLIVLVVYYRKAIGTPYVVAVLVLVVVELILQAQSWWDYTPANIFLALGAMVVYSRMWLVQKERHIENERLLAEQRADLENARSKLVLSQIKPHFLFNTLSTIAYLCTKKPEMARGLCIDLAAYLRSNLSALDSGVQVAFEEELKHVEAYLKIEKVRFGEKLNVELDIEDTDFKLPVLTVEPLVENAVKHGIRKQSKGGTVTIATREEPDWHVVCVRDDGAGFDIAAFDENASEHVGLRSVRKRIEDLNHGTLSIDSLVGQGTTATLRIPKYKASST